MQQPGQHSRFDDIPSTSGQADSDASIHAHSEVFREYQHRLSQGFTHVLEETLETLENRVALLNAIRTDPALLLRVGARMMDDAKGLLKPETWEANWKQLKDFSAETEAAINENDPVKLGELAGVAFMAALGTKGIGGIDLPKHGHSPDMHHARMAPHDMPTGEASATAERGTSSRSYEKLIQSIKDWEIRNGSPENIEEWLRMHDEIDAELPPIPRKHDPMPAQQQAEPSSHMPGPHPDEHSAYTTSALLAATVYAIWHETSEHEHLAELAQAYTRFTNAQPHGMQASYRETIEKYPELKEAATAYKSIRESLSSDGTTSLQERQVLEVVANATRTSILNGELGNLSATPFRNNQIRENEMFLPPESAPER